MHAADVFRRYGLAPSAPLRSRVQLGDTAQRTTIVVRSCRPWPSMTTIVCEPDRRGQSSGPSAVEVPTGSPFTSQRSVPVDAADRAQRQALEGGAQRGIAQVDGAVRWVHDAQAPVGEALARAGREAAIGSPGVAAASSSSRPWPRAQAR